MKHTAIFALLLATMTTITSACITKSDSTNDAASGKWHMETLDISDFENINNSSNVLIVYTDSEEYAVKVNWNGKKHSRIYKDGTTLIIEKLNRHKDARNKITIHINAPRLDNINNKGVMTVKGNLNTSTNFRINNEGVMNLNDININNIETHIRNKGVMTINSDIRANNLVIANNGVMNTVSDIRCNKAEMTLNGVTNMESRIRAKSMFIKNNGTGYTEITYSGNDMNIYNNGCNNMEIEVDCHMLCVENKGVGKMTLKGTARKTKINGSATAKIDKANLNKP